MKKLFPTVLLLFLLLTVFSFPAITKKNTLRTNYEIEKQNYPNQTVYLLNKNGYLVEIKVMVQESKMVENIIEYLKEDNNSNAPWKGYIPKDVEVLDHQLKNGLLEIHFSEEAKNIKKEYLSGIVASFEKNKYIDKANLFIEQEPITNIPSMNLEPNYGERRNLEKIVVFYIEDSYNDHLIPVTRYHQPSNDKMSVILEELKNKIPSQLISYISDQLELKDYQIENDVMILDFNQELVKDPEKREVTLKEIAYSIMGNYNVNAVLFKVNGKVEELILKNS